MIDRETVIWAYRLILGREPECEESITFHRQHASVLQLRKTLMSSDEFMQFQPTASRPHEAVGFPSWDDLHAPRLVFMHCPKTGGTTLHELLVQSFSTSQICPERFNGVKNLPTGQLLQYQFFSGHYDLISCQLIPGAKRIITFLREPVGRLLSLYNFLRAHRPDVVARNGWGLARLAMEFEVEAFFSQPIVRSHPYLNNGMSRALVGALPIEVWPNVDEALVLPDITGKSNLALERLKELFAFGLLEQYEPSVKLVFSALGLPQPKAIERKMALTDLVNQPGNYRPVESAQVTPELRAVVEDLVNMDRELYIGAQALLEQRLMSVKT
ncbi:MAG: hypothetical protein V4812_06395 [Pseudomonadota bacterium]